MTGYVAVAQVTVLVVTFAIVATGLLQNLLQIVQLGLAGAVLMRRPPARRAGILWHRYAEVSPPVALIVPAFNEAKNVADNVRSLLGLEYPNVEVIVVNDGSTDNTLEALIEAFDLALGNRDFEARLPHKPIRGLYLSPREARLVVVDKENAGKADALNCAINLARTPLVCSIDADSLLERDSLLRAVKPFVDDPESTVAVGGTVRVANGCKVVRGQVREVGLSRRLLPLFQTIEYLRTFLMARLAWSEVATLTIVSGAFGLFRRQIVVDVGGYSAGTVGEDFELVIKIHRHMRDRGRDYRIAFIPEPVCWTEVPESLAVLGRQRARWHRGALETFFKHRLMLGRRRYGRIGIVGFTNMLLVDVMGPVAEVLGYLLIPLLWILGWLSIDYLLAFLSLTFTFGIAISVGALVIEEIELRRFVRTRDLAILFLAAIAENLGYRQLNNVWRLRGLWQFIRGSGGWGTMVRTGFRHD